MSVDAIDITGDGKLTKVIIREGTGEIPTKGQKVSVHYVGTLESDGSEFDSSRGRGEPFEFTIGSGVIEGWSKGVATMKVGELSKFTIHSDLGYGSTGSGKIPANATLVFEIELLDIIKNLSDAEAKDEAEKLNTEAGTLFKNGDFLGCEALYQQALKLIKSKYGSEFTELKKKYNNNLAMVYSKLNNWYKCINHAEEVLKQDANNAKAIVRKLEAEIGLERIDEARKTYQKGISITKSDPSFVKLIEKINDAEKRLQQTRDSLFQKMTKK